MTDNKKNRGLSGITLFLFVLIVLGALWYTNTLDSKESQLSRQKFEKLITSEKVDSVSITQNKNVPQYATTLLRRVHDLRADAVAEAA